MIQISISALYIYSSFFFFNDSATTEIYTLSLHDALPISVRSPPSSPLASRLTIHAISAVRSGTPLRAGAACAADAAGAVEAALAGRAGARIGSGRAAAAKAVTKGRLLLPAKT